MTKDFHFWSLFVNFVGSLAACLILYSSALLWLYPESKYALFTAAEAVHSPLADDAKNFGLPNWCCNPRDCEFAEVKLLSYQKGFPIVEVNGATYRVVGRGQGDGREGVFFAERKTAWCPVRAGDARCVSIKPQEQF